MKFTKDQLAALDAMDRIALDPNEKVLIVTGSAGTGKSTLIKEFIKRYVNLYQNITNLVDGITPELILTATTNKASNNLSDITGHETSTIQKYLGMFKSGNSVMYPKKEIKNKIIIIDEFSYIDTQLLKALQRNCTPSTKLIFIGDECQLPPPNEKNNRIPVIEDTNFKMVRLSQQVRQETSILKELGEDLKEFVLTGDMNDFSADGKSIIHYTDEDLFSDNLIKSFDQGSSRFISYTNARGVAVNEYVHEERTGTGQINNLDEMVVNSYFVQGRTKLPTDTLGVVSNVHQQTRTLRDKEGTLHDIVGKCLIFRGVTVFVPDDFNDFNYYKGNKDLFGKTTLENIEATWCDLRHLYASTVHKSQGSTFDQVFIDLTDFQSIRDQSMLARLLYVALTRARKKVHIIGDI